MMANDEGIAHATFVGKHVEEEALASGGKRFGTRQLLGGDD